MATTTARNQQDVNNMSARERLWDSLNYSYGKKREESDKSFAKAYSQAVNQGIKTGMQRSSYGAQTLANINKQQIDAQNDIYDSLIADYENRVYQLERDELEDAWKQKQFDESQRQYNETLAFQKSEANRSQANWEKDFGETQKQNEWNRNFQQSQADRSQSNWEKEFAETQLMNQFNRDYMQDEFKYKYGLAGGGSGGGGYGGSNSPGTNNPGSNPPPSTGPSAEQLAKTLEEIQSKKDSNKSTTSSNWVSAGMNAVTAAANKKATAAAVKTTDKKKTGGGGTTRTNMTK